MNVKGMLIGVRSYSFPDKETGEQIKGAKVSIGVRPDDNRASGYLVQEISALYEDYPALSKVAQEYAGKPCVVECDVQLKGRYTKLRASKIVAA